MDEITLKITISNEHFEKLNTVCDDKNVSINELIEFLIDKAHESRHDPR